jgi:hypothetical protein
MQQEAGIRLPTAAAGAMGARGRTCSPEPGHGTSLTCEKQRIIGYFHLQMQHIYSTNSEAKYFYNKNNLNFIAKINH